MNTHLKKWLFIALLCALLVPLLVYVGGLLLVGPYEGESGILGLMITLYGDAALGKASALITLFAPLLLIAIWKFSNLLRRIIDAQLATQGGN